MTIINCQTTEFLKNVKYLEKLEFLSVESSNINDITLDSIFELEDLIVFKIYRCTFNENLFKGISKLKNLKDFRIDDNPDCLTKFPDSISQLEELTTLSIDNNSITVLPESIGLLKNLKTLSICGNGITNIPESIGLLKSLESFYANNNKIKEIPKSLFHLENLFRIHLDNNELRHIPNEVTDLKSLKYISVSIRGNPLIKNSTNIALGKLRYVNYDFHDSKLNNFFF